MIHSKRLYQIKRILSVFLSLVMVIVALNLLSIESKAVNQSFCEFIPEYNKQKGTLDVTVCVHEIKEHYGVCLFIEIPYGISYQGFEVLDKEESVSVHCGPTVDDSNIIAVVAITNSIYTQNSIDLVELHFNVINESAVRYLEFELEYDSNVDDEIPIEYSVTGHRYIQGVCKYCGASDPSYKLSPYPSEYISFDNQTNTIIIFLKKTSGINGKEFKDNFEIKPSIPIDDNSLIYNGFFFKFNNEIYNVIVKGDVTADGKITASDARMVLRIAARLESVDADAFSAADINGDWKVTPSEARKVLRFVARLENSIA